MDNWLDVLVKPTDTIEQTLRVIDRGAIGLAIVVDDNFLLLGTVTDGDIRRALIHHKSLLIPVSQIMNSSPKSVRVGVVRDELLQLFTEYDVAQIPIVDHENRLCGLETLKQTVQTPQQDNWVVIMAGGFGTRLRPFTHNCPKPLLKIEEKPLLQIIMEGFKASGFNRFIFCVNYLASMIEDYFKDGSQFDCEIRYVNESQPLGTAGALSLLPFKPDKPFFVMNGDIMTRLNYQHMLNFHYQQNSCATLCVRSQQHQVPYGVVASNNYQLHTIEEKPNYQYFINAGIYVLEPEILSLIKPNEPCNMTDLLQGMVSKGYRVSTFPIQEYWQDIGRPEDFNQAKKDYQELFYD